MTNREGERGERGRELSRAFIVNSFGVCGVMWAWVIMGVIYGWARCAVGVVF